MRDETWGAIGWWIGAIIKWSACTGFVLLVLYLVVAYFAHGGPF